MKTKNDLLEALAKEISIKSNPSLKVSSIYFGGGTPSLLSRMEIEKLLTHLSLHFDVSSVSEITFEANPEDLTIEYTKALANLGIDRLSIGIQSFFAEDLVAMNRVHNNEQAHQSISNAFQAGISKVNVDLIYGLPWSPKSRFEENLDLLTTYPIDHLSAYALTVEPKTALAHQIKKGQQKNADDDHAHHDFSILQSWALDNDFEHYEISNLSKPGCRAVHNSNYWNRVPYHGFGPGAHSYFQGKRSWNIANNLKYISSLQANELPCETEVLAPEDDYNEHVMTGLRLSDGINMDQISNLGQPFVDFLLSEAKSKIQAGILINQNNRLKLVKDQMFFADGHASDLFWI